MNIRFVYIALLLPLFAQAEPIVRPDGNGTFTRAESYSHSTAFPLTTYLNSLVGPEPEDGEFVISRNSIEFGYRWDRLEISLVHRNDQNLIFSPETAEFAYLNKNGTGINGIPTDRLYQVYVKANQYQLTGVKTAYTLPITDEFEVFGRYSFYRASEMVAGTMGADPDGQGGFIGATPISIGGSTRNDLTGSVYADYYYTKDPLFRSDERGSSGIGYSFDFGFNWRALPNLTVSANLYDAINAVYWKDLPHTRARALGSSDALTVGDDGVIEVEPNFVGNDSRDDYTQRLTSREVITVDYRYKNLQLGYQWDHMKYYHFYRIIGGYNWLPNWGLTASYDLASEAIGFAFKMPAGDLAFTFDTLDFDNAHTLGFSWAFTIAL